MLKMLNPINYDDYNPRGRINVSIGCACLSTWIALSVTGVCVWMVAGVFEWL